MFSKITMAYPGKDSSCLQKIPFVHRDKISKKLCEIRKKRNSPIKWSFQKVFQQEMKQNFQITVIQNGVLHVTFGYEQCIIWQLKTKDITTDSYGNYNEVTLYAIAEENKYKGRVTNGQDWELVNDYQIQDANGVYDYFCIKSGIFNGTSVSINGAVIETLESFREEIFNWLPESNELQIDKSEFDSNVDIELDEAAIRRNLKSTKNKKKYESISKSMKKLGINNLHAFCDIIIQTLLNDTIPMVKNNRNLVEIQRYFKDGKVHDEFILPLEIQRGNYYFKASVACIAHRDYYYGTIYRILGRVVNPAFVTMSNVALAHDNGEIPRHSWVSQMNDNSHSFFQQVKQPQQQQYEQHQLLHPQPQQHQQQQHQQVEQSQQPQQPQQQQESSFEHHCQEQAPIQQAPIQQAAHTSALAPVLGQLNRDRHDVASAVRTIHSRNRVEKGVISSVDMSKNDKKENGVYRGKNAQGYVWCAQQNRRVDERRSVLNKGQRQKQEEAEEKISKQTTVDAVASVASVACPWEEKEKEKEKATEEQSNGQPSMNKLSDKLYDEEEEMNGTVDFALNLGIKSAKGKTLEREAGNVLERESELLEFSNTSIDNKIHLSEDGLKNCTSGDSIGRIVNGGSNDGKDKMEEKNSFEEDSKRRMKSRLTITSKIKNSEKDIEENRDCNFVNGSGSVLGGLWTSQVLAREKKWQEIKKEINIFDWGHAWRWSRGKSQIRDAAVVSRTPVPWKSSSSTFTKRLVDGVNEMNKDDESIMKIMTSIASVTRLSVGKKEKVGGENVSININVETSVARSVATSTSRARPTSRQGRTKMRRNKNALIKPCDCEIGGSCDK